MVAKEIETCFSFLVSLPLIPPHLLLQSISQGPSWPRAWGDYPGLLMQKMLNVCSVEGTVFGTGWGNSGRPVRREMNKLVLLVLFSLQMRCVPR